MNYTEIQSGVVNYFKRSDITGRIPAWIQLAEAFMFREISPKSIRASVTGDTSGGLIALPADFDAVVRLTTTVAGNERNIDYIAAPDESAQVGGYPYGYSLEGDSLRLHPASGDATAYKLYYTPRLEALTGAADTNWLSTNGADLYIYATALQGAAEMKNDREIATLTPVVQRLLEAVKSYAQKTGQPQSSGMQVKPRRGF